MFSPLEGKEKTKKEKGKEKEKKRERHLPLRTYGQSATTPSLGRVLEVKL